MFGLQLVFIPLLSLLPCIIWLIYFWRQDRYDPEPFKNIAFTFLLGMATTVLALIANTTGIAITHFILGRNPFADIVSFFLIVGPVEEVAKFLAVYAYVYRRPEFDEPVDGVVYSATAALGFAAAENILYLSGFGPGVVFYRAILSNPGHALFSAFWGLAISRAKAMPNLPEKRLPTIIRGLLLGAIMHALFNTILTLGPIFGQLITSQAVVITLITLPLVALMIGMFAYVKLQIHEMLERSPHKEGTSLLGGIIPCPHCSTLGQTGQFCIQCGLQVSAPTDQRYCLECGARQRLGASFCNKCGASMLKQSPDYMLMIQPHFVIVEPTGRKEIACVINNSVMRVGKTLDNDFVVDHPTVSKRHAQIYWHESQQYYLKDSGSTNGTFINGKRISEAPLRDGCEVRFGSISFVFKTAQPEPVRLKIQDEA